MLLSAWKMDLSDGRFKSSWGRGLDGESFWALVNYVIDKVTLPSCDVFVGCSLSEPGTPLCWTAVRKLKGLSTYEMVYLGARKSVMNDAALAAVMETTLLSEIEKIRPITKRRTLNPFTELKR
jgi:hypothetical protein